MVPRSWPRHWDFRVGCERSSFRFLAAAYGQINSTWTLPNQVGWPMAKELLFTARIVEAQEAYRIGLINHLVPVEELRAKTMELATTIADNRHESVMGIKELLLSDMGGSLSRHVGKRTVVHHGKGSGYRRGAGLRRIPGPQGESVKPLIR